MYEMTLAEKVDFNMLQVKCLPYAVVMLNLTIIVVLSVILSIKFCYKRIGSCRFVMLTKRHLTI